MKKQIQPALKALEINQSIAFDSSYKYTVIASAIQAIQNDSEMGFSMKKNKSEKSVTVTRKY